MARPCGCGSTCNCVIHGGIGIDVSGGGTTASPYIIDFDGSELAGPGIQWSNGQFATKLVPGGGIEYDVNGAMYTTGGGGEGGPLDLVTPLAAQPTIVGGFMGAGHLMHPEGFRSSYEAGLTNNIDFMHAAVRFVADGTPVISWDQNFGRTVYHPYNLNYEHWEQLQVAEVTPAFWRTLPQPSGMYDSMQAWQPSTGDDPLQRANWEPARYHPFAPAYGWFGYMAEPQYGGTFLADILRICVNKLPLVLQLRWPTEVLQPSVIPPWRTHAFLRKMRSQILRFRMQRQVIVTTTAEHLTIPPESGTTDTDVLTFFSQVGIPVGPILLDTADMTANPPANFAGRTWTWAVLPADSSAATQIGTYPAAGVNAVVSPANRQYLYNALVAPSGVNGAISSDPVYYGGGVGAANHVLGTPTYRNIISRYRDHVILNGLLHPADSDMTRQGPAYRGALHIEPNSDSQNQIHLGPTMQPPVGRTYWVLQGWACPLDQPTNIGIDFSLQMDNPGWVGSGSDWVAVAFGIPTDHAFADWHNDGVTPPRPGRELDSGYCLYMAQNSFCYLTWFDRGAWGGTTQFRPLTNTQPGMAGRKRFKICVDPRGIRICAVEVDGNWRELATVTTEPHTRFRGQYMYFGRMGSAESAVWNGRVIEPFTAPGAGTAWWDAAIPRA